MRYRILKWILDAGGPAVEIDACSIANVVVGHQPDRMDETQVGIWLMVPVDLEGQIIPGFKRRFEVVGTGHPIDAEPTDVTWRGSAVCGQFVWHVIERMV